MTDQVTIQISPRDSVQGRALTALPLAENQFGRICFQKIDVQRVMTSADMRLTVISPANLNAEDTALLLEQMAEGIRKEQFGAVGLYGLPPMPKPQPEEQSEPKSEP